MGTTGSGTLFVIIQILVALAVLTALVVVIRHYRGR